MADATRTGPYQDSMASSRAERSYFGHHLPHRRAGDAVTHMNPTWVHQIMLYRSRAGSEGKG